MRAANTFSPNARSHGHLHLDADGGRRTAYQRSRKPDAPDSHPNYPDLPASKWYDYGFKEGLPRLLEIFDRCKIKALPTWSALQSTCARRSQKKSFSVATKPPDTVKHGLPSSP